MAKCYNHGYCDSGWFIVVHVWAMFSAFVSVVAVSTAFFCWIDTSIETKVEEHIKARESEEIPVITVIDSKGE